MESYSTSLSTLDISYYLTSIYDHSVSSSFSKVVQKLVPALDTIVCLMNALVDRCGMEKAFLFDVASKLYIATDEKDPSYLNDLTRGRKIVLRRLHSSGIS